MLRIPLGIVFFAHGAQKMLGWFGGQGWSATISGMSGPMGFAPFWVALAILSEFFGGMGILSGLLTRLSALGIAITMLVAIFNVHLANGFFINWYMTPGVGHGFEYNLVLLFNAIILVMRGAGRISIDRLVRQWFVK